jgi:hypothetical protein
VNQSGGRVITSPDGVTWAAQDAGTTKALYSIAFGGGKFVAAGNGGTVLTSTNGSSWSPQDSGTQAHLYSIAYDGARFVTTGGGGAILSSSDGTNWTPKNTESITQWRSVGFGNGATVVVGYRTESPFSYTRSAASTTLNTWEFRDTGPLLYLSGLTFGGGKFVACGYGGIIQTSTNGIDWTPDIHPVNAWLNAVAFAGGTYVAVGESGVIISSADAVDWQVRRSVLGSVLNDVTFGNNSWVAVGGKGLILQSSAGATPPPPVLAITEPRKAGDRFSFKVTGVPGQTYDVQVTGTMTGWLTVTSVTTQATPTPVELTGQTQRDRSYRVKAR